MSQLTRPEHQLLLCCARTVVDESLAARIRSFASQSIDWDYLIQMARRHAVFPLLYRQLQAVAPDLVPAEHLRRLKKDFRENAARNVVLTAELTRLIQLLATKGIEAIPYKGPFLAQFAYGDLALRRFVDLDVMVRKSDAVKAAELLQLDGYTTSGSLNAQQQHLLLNTQHNLQLSRDNKHFILELHWEVSSHLFASTVSADELWGTLVRAKIGDIEVKTLATEDLLFSLCVHGSRHLWERLSWVCDVAELLSKQEIKWDPLRKRIQQAESERMFLLGLRLASDLFEVQLPPEIRKVVDGDRRLEVLSRKISERLFNGTQHVPATPAEILSFNLAVRKNWKARARYFTFMLQPTDGDVSALTLPRGFGFAYYLFRPLRLMNKPSRGSHDLN